MNDLEIRLARPEDRDDVFEISSTVWDGNDYIPEVWEDWIRQPPQAGFMVAGEMDGKVVAIQHTSLQRGGVAWMEGIRVHPDYRNRGIARQLLDRAIDMAGERGMTRVRLSTADVNPASQAVAEKAGLHEIGHFNRYTAPPSTDDVVEVEERLPSEADLETVLASRHEGSLVADGWTAYDVPAQKRADEFDVGFVAGPRPDGLALATATPHRGRLSVALVAGTAAAVTALGHALRRKAASLGVDSAGGMLRLGPETESALLAAGFEKRDDLSMIVFERALPAA